MFARVSTFEGAPERIEEGIRIFSSDVIPWLKDARGFRGWLVLLDRENERALGITFWASEAAAVDSPESGARLRDEVAATVETKMTSLAYYEVAHVEGLELDEAR